MIVFTILGAAIMIICGIWLLVVIFKESVLWGLASLVIPLVSLIFVIMHWDDCKKPFLYHLGGFGIFLLGALSSG